MPNEEKLTAVNTTLLDRVIALIEERGLEDELSDELREKLQKYKSLTQDND